jgi:hypothetical protein
MASSVVDCARFWAAVGKLNCFLTWERNADPMFKIFLEFVLPLAYEPPPFQHLYPAGL